MQEQKAIPIEWAMGLGVSFPDRHASVTLITVDCDTYEPAPRLTLKQKAARLAIRTFFAVCELAVMALSYALIWAIVGIIALCLCALANKITGQHIF